MPVSTSGPIRKTFYRSDFWFKDGNIVIVAGQVAFKVHRGQLERHSEVFRDLFTLPQPPVQEMIEGCPWFELHDPPADLLALLKALYDGLYVISHPLYDVLLRIRDRYFQKASSFNFPVISAVLRLSTKYLIDHLRERCLVHMATDWPSTLEAWDQREKLAVDDAGRYSPDTRDGQSLLAHELAHVVQQSRGASAPLSLSQNSYLERAADHAASALARGDGRIRVPGASAAAIARQPAAPPRPVPRPRGRGSAGRGAGHRDRDRRACPNRRCRPPRPAPAPRRPRAQEPARRRQ